ncbi:MAG: transglutaminaseTgpA domain-containing protein [Thermoanaerobaculia bacterium]
MKRVPPEAESILLAMAAALPLYFSAAISIQSVLIYHLVLAATFTWKLRNPAATLPRPLLRALALAYFLFYFVDGIAFSRSLIKATGHLLFFIAAYQSVDRDAQKNHPQRLLVIFLIAIASIATSTHITIVLFVAGFVFMLLRQMVALSREESARLLGTSAREVPVNRSVAAYLAVLFIAAAAFFPLLPRVRNPFVRGAGFSSQGASTGFSDAIDFSQGQVITPDPRVVARVTVPTSAEAEFLPLRLRGGHYDRWVSGRWTARPVRTQQIVAGPRGFDIARPAAGSQSIEVRQTRTVAQNQRLYLPVGTWQVRGVGSLAEGPNQGAWNIPGPGDAMIDFEVSASGAIDPLVPPRRLPTYEVPEAIRALADRIAGNATTPRENASVISSHLSTNYAYVASPISLGEPVGVEDFLLTKRTGHCEHFAAGMVLLLSARGVPARVVGGYYGGEYNPLGGYYVIRQRDAHAWVEIWEGTRWTTWDPTPSDMRPGADQPGVFMAYLSAIGESINFFWDRYILTFGLSDQVNLMASAFYTARDAIGSLRGGFSISSQLRPAAIVIVLGVAAIFGALALRRRRRLTLFDLLARRLAKAGLTVAPSMTSAEVVVLVRRNLPAVAGVVARIVDLYERDRFSPNRLSRDEAREARMALKQVG